MSQENKKLTLLLLVLVGICVCVAYIPAIQSEFIWDDDDYVTENPTLRTPQGLADIWTERYSIPQWYPLVHTTFWLEYQTWQLNAHGYHVTNVLIHVASMLLLFLVLRHLAVPGALFAVAIFGLHPVMVESVAWITERKNVLSLFAILRRCSATCALKTLMRRSRRPGGHGASTVSPWRCSSWPCSARPSPVRCRRWCCC